MNKNGFFMKVRGFLIILNFSIIGFSACASICSEIEQSYIKERCTLECIHHSHQQKNENKISAEQNYRFTGNIETVQCTESGTLLGTCHCKLE